MHTAEQKRILWRLFTAFFRIGLFTFGGGYSMLPMLQREVVEKNGWSTETELLDYFAIGQCLPGIIAVNTATLIGHKQKGAPGGIAAALGVVFPSLLIITIIAAVLENFAHIPAVQHAFAGIRVAVAALITATVIRLFKTTVLTKAENGRQPFNAVLRQSWLQLLLCALAFVAVAVLGLSPIYVVLGAVAVGLLCLRRRAK